MFYQKPLVTAPPCLVITDMAVSQNKGTPKMVALILGNPYTARVAMQKSGAIAPQSVPLIFSKKNVGFRV